jgi:hypothetical protein
MARFSILIFLLSLNAAGQDTLADATISLQRTGCLGTCPGYKITIGADGAVFYEGQHNVHAKGIRKTKIKRSDFEVLVKEFQEANFFGMSGGGINTDAPVMTLSLTLNGRHKELKEGCACPPELVRLENDVDKVSGSERWVRGRLRMFLHWPWVRS